MKALIALMVFFAVSHSALADEDGDHDRVRRAVEEGRIQPLRDILNRARIAFPGELISAEFEEERGTPRYEIKILTPEGRLIKILYDARTGTLLKPHGGETR